jgi:hypothetical protein
MTRSTPSSSAATSATEPIRSATVRTVVSAAELPYPFGRAFHFGLSDVTHPVHELPVEVRRLDRVEVDQDDFAHAETDEVHQHRRAQAADAEQENRRLPQLAVVRDGPEVQVREGLQEPEVVAPALPLIPRDRGQRVGVDEQPGFVQCAQCRAEVFDAQGGRDLGGGAGAVRAVQEPLEDVVGVTEPDQVGRGRVHRDREVGALPDPRDGLGKGSHALSPRLVGAGARWRHPRHRAPAQVVSCTGSGST